MAEQMLLCCDEEYITRRAIRDRVLLTDDRVLKNHLAAEERYMPSTSNFLFQKDLEPYMRKVVATWLLEVCEEQKREEDVFPLAMNYLDRVLSTTLVKRSQLQLVAAVCLFVASKVRETYPIDAEKLVQYTDFSVTLDDIQQWELLVLNILKWDTSSILAHDFLDLLLTRLPLDEKKRKQVLRHAQTLIAMCATEYSFSVHPPSVLASAGICAAVMGLPFLGQSWGQEVSLVHRLHDLTSIDGECIRACQEQIEQTLLSNVISASNENDFRSTSSPASNQKSPPSDAVALTPTDVRDIHLCY